MGEWTETLPSPVPYGQILIIIRLDCDLQYLNGVSPYDIMVKYGVSYAEGIGVFGLLQMK